MIGKPDTLFASLRSERTKIPKPGGKGRPLDPHGDKVARRRRVRPEWGSLAGVADLAGISGSRRLGPSSRFRMSMYALRRACRPRSARTTVFLESSGRIPMEARIAHYG
jgi:hypothetical protein